MDWGAAGHGAWIEPASKVSAQVRSLAWWAGILARGLPGLAGRFAGMAGGVPGRLAGFASGVARFDGGLTRYARFAGCTRFTGFAPYGCRVHICSSPSYQAKYIQDFNFSFYLR